MATVLDLTPAQIGQTWLNYIVEGKTILWWGGIGDVTEHTAYLRLKQGIKPPLSGSIALNGRIMAEQIGSQIFIDGWGMIAPGEPELAADLARRAACVSHDGEAIFGAQVVAALIAQAFVEPDINRLIDVAVSLIPADSITYRMIERLRGWHAGQPDWHKTISKIDSEYSRERYPGNCHIVPNHARIILALLYGDDDFQKSMMVVNTSGFDSDCNSGNVGCIMGRQEWLGWLGRRTRLARTSGRPPVSAHGRWRQRHQRCAKRKLQVDRYRARHARYGWRSNPRTARAIISACQAPCKASSRKAGANRRIL